MATDFKIQSESLEQGVELITVQGDVNMDGSMYLQEYLDKLLAHAINRIVLDFSAAEYINSRGIGVISSFYKKCSEAGGNLVLVSPGPKVMNVLKVTFLTRVIPIVANRTEALNLFQNI